MLVYFCFLYDMLTALTSASNFPKHCYLYSSAMATGGCCDCGDPEAWATCGNCAVHNGKISEKDPSEVLPADLVLGLKAVLDGVLGVLTSFAASTARAYDCSTENEFVRHFHYFHALENESEVKEHDYDEQGRTPREQYHDVVVSTKDIFCVNVHNDDVHTYQDVTSHFRTYASMNAENAINSTKLVDQEGYASVVEVKVSGGEENLSLSSIEDLHSKARALRTPVGDSKMGLLTSIAPKRLFDLEQRITAALKWMEELGKQNDGVRRVITNAFLQSPLRLPETAVALQDCFGICKPNEIFSDGTKFPCVIPHLQKMPTGMVADDKDSLFVHSPFKRNCERNILGVLMMSSPFFMKSVKHALSSLVVIYQQDPVFKACFSQMLTILYPALYGLFGRYIGTKHDEIFNTTVQVYTANRVVTMMSSDGLAMRPLSEPADNPVFISRMLAQTLYYTLLDMGCLPDRQNDDFLKHHSLRSHRHQQLLRDFEYVTENVLGSLQLLCGARDVGVLEIWIKVSLLVQNMYEMARFTESHVEIEDNVMWHTSTTLTLELESASTNVVNNSLFPSAELLAAESQAASGNIDSVGEKLAGVETASQQRSASLVDFDLRKLQQQALQNSVRQVVQLGLNAWTTSARAKLGAPAEISSSDGAYTILGCELGLPNGYKILRYDVASHPVSINNPIHRLIAKIFLFASYSNLNLSPALKHISEASVQSKVTLADFPLRALVFSAQVSANMWKRNGLAPENLVYHYNKGPLNKVLKLMDIHSVQIALLSFEREIGADLILALAIERFCVKSLLEDPAYFILPGNMNNAYLRKRRMLEYQGGLLAGLLKILINIIVCVPTCLLEKSELNHPGGAYADSVDNALSREIVNLVLSGASTLSQLSIATSMVGGDKTVSENTLNDVIRRLCTRREASEAGEKTTLELRAGAYVYFDPEYGHLTQDQQNRSSDRIRELRKQLERERGDSFEVVMHIPVLHPDALPAAHPDFEQVRSLLFRPIMYKLLARSVELAIASANDLGSAKHIVIERVVYILTLQVHFRARYQLENEAKLSGSSLYPCAEHNAFLKAIADLWLSDALSEDDLYKNGLAFVLESTVRTEDQFIRDYFETRGILFAAPISTTVVGSDEKAGLCLVSVQQAREIAEKARLLKLKSVAQQKAIATLQKATSNFMMEMEGWSDVDSEEDDESTVSAQKDSIIEKVAAGNSPNLDKIPVRVATCMICRKSASEASGDPPGTDNSMGYLCFLQPSNNLKHATSSGESTLNKVFRVVSATGCFVYVRVITTSPLDPVNASCVSGRLARGEHVLVSRRIGRWVHIVAPVSGWVEVYTERMRFKGEPAGSTGTVFEQSTCTDSCKDVILVRNLQSLDEFMYARHGPTRLHASFCGHCMHFDCWNEYFANTVSRETSYLYAHDPPLAFDVSDGEFICPLCKSISNAFLPLTTPESASRYWAHITDDNPKQPQKSAFEEWLVNVEHRKASSPVKFSVNMLLNTPEVPAWGNGKESLRLLESISASYALPWRTELENTLVKLPDEEGNKEIQLTRGCHSMWACIAYTLQVQYFASVWTAGHTGPSLGSETVGFAAQLLNMLRQMPNWFEGLESFEDCIGTPLKLLVSGCRTDVEGDDMSHSASVDAKVGGVRAVDELTIAECREALLSTSFETVGSSRFNNPRRISLLQQILHHKGIQACDLWGTLTIPLLAQDLAGIAVASVACAADVRSAEAVLGILCVARLSQILIEPTCTGISAASKTELLSLLKADGEVRFKSATPPVAEKPLLQFTDPENDTDGVCRLLKQLQDAIITGAGLDSSKRASIMENMRTLVLDEWLPFLEFVVCLLHSFRCAVSGLAEPVPDIRSASFEWLLQRCGLPSSLLQLLSSPVLAMLGSRWGDQLGHVRPARLRGEPVASWIPKVVDFDPFDIEKVRVCDVVSDTCSYGSAGALVDEVMHQIMQLHILEQERLRSQELDAVDAESRKKGKHEASTLLDFLPKVLGTTAQHISAEYEKSLHAMGASAPGAHTGHQTAFARSLARKIVFTVKDNAAKAIGRPILEDYAAAEVVAVPAEGEGSGASALIDDSISDIDVLSGDLGADASNPSDVLSLGELRSEPLKTWKLIGIDPCYRSVDGGFPLFELNSMTATFQSVHTQSPFIGTIHGQTRSYDLLGQPLLTSFCDLSHLPLRSSQHGGLLNLPPVYTELIDCMQLPYEPKLDEQGKREDEPALCLICGSILNAGNRAKKLPASSNLDNAFFKESPGECALHTRTCGAGVGIFMFMLQNQIYLMRDGRASKYGALYLDKNGETGEGRGHNRPLTLCIPRFQKLDELYIKHQVASEVTRKRLTQDRSIRSFYY